MLKCNFTLCVLIHDRDMEILPLGSAPLRHRLLWITAVSLVSPHSASGRCPNLQETARTPCQKSRWSRCGTWKSWFNKMLSNLGLCFVEVVNLQWDLIAETITGPSQVFFRYAFSNVTIIASLLAWAAELHTACSLCPRRSDLKAMAFPTAIDSRAKSHELGRESQFRRNL